MTHADQQHVPNHSKYRATRAAVNGMRCVAQVYDALWPPGPGDQGCRPVWVARCLACFSNAWPCRSSDFSSPAPGATPLAARARVAFISPATRSRWSAIDSSALCSVVYVESCDADPLASARVSASNVFVANLPTLELSCRYSAPSAATRESDVLGAASACVITWPSVW